MSLLIADIKIKGTRPLLFNRFAIDTISLHKKEQTGVAGNDPEEWKRTYSATSDGQLYLDSGRAWSGVVRYGLARINI